MKRYILVLTIFLFVIEINHIQSQPKSGDGRKMKAEIFYFDGCPSYKTTYKNLKAALKELALAAEIKLVLVDSPEKAETLHFQGSPSIRIDGRDLENVNEGFTYGCRVYSFKGKLTGAPTKEYIKEKIKQNVTSSSSKDK